MNRNQYGVRFYTQRPTETIENWIRGHCAGDWDIRLAGFDQGPADGMGKRLIVFFNNPRDRKVFQKYLRDAQYSVDLFTNNRWDKIESFLQDSKVDCRDIRLGGLVEGKNGWAGKKITVFFDSLRDKKAFEVIKNETYIHYTIRFFTRRPATEFEDWLNSHCHRGWEIRLDGFGENEAGHIVKQLNIRFESHRDRAMFEQHYLHLTPAPTGPRRVPLVHRLLGLLGAGSLSPSG